MTRRPYQSRKAKVTQRERFQAAARAHDHMERCWDLYGGKCAASQRYYNLFLWRYTEWKWNKGGHSHA